MTKSRLEAFTDGVMAIVITILVLEVRFPEAPTLASILAMKSILLAYAVSFLFVAVIWVSHHRVMRMTEKVNDNVIWANIFWLFWLTLCPAVTQWVGVNPGKFWPELCYVLVYTMWSVSFGILTKQIIKANENSAKVVQVLQKDRRSQLSMVINFCLILLVFIYPPVGLMGRFLVSALWIPSYEAADRLHDRFFSK